MPRKPNGTHMNSRLIPAIAHGVYRGLILTSVVALTTVLAIVIGIILGVPYGTLADLAIFTSHVLFVGAGLMAVGSIVMCVLMLCERK